MIGAFRRSLRAESRASKRHPALNVVLAVAALLLLSFAGCSRPFWRTQADFDAYNMMLEKSANPQWDVPRLSLESDPRSRIFNPYDPDFEPLPPDDPAANQYMHWMDGIRGYRGWDKMGQQFTFENPKWLEQFELKPQEFTEEWLQPTDPPADPFLVPTIPNLTLEQAIELANINSRDYQLQLETTYQAALVLTFARFQFNVRYLGINGLQPTSNLTYIQTPPQGVSTLPFSNRFGVSQLMPSGGQWIAEIANNTLWLFSSPGQTNSASALTFSLVQPLAYGASRKVVLESLTLAERRLLYAIRTLARFRKTFFGTIVVGSPGYLDLLSQYQQIENTRFNLRELRLQLEKLQAAYSQKPPSVSEELPKPLQGLEIPPDLAPQLKYDAKDQSLTWSGDMTEETEQRLLALSEDRDYRRAIQYIAAAFRTDVITTDLSQLLTRETSTVSSLRSLEASYEQSIDTFKLTLGIPTDFQISLDRSMLKPFELIDPRINGLEDRLQQTIKTWGDIDGADPNQERLKEVAAQLKGMWREVADVGLRQIEADLAREEKNRPARLARLPSEEDKLRVQQNVERDRLFFRRNEDDHAELGEVLTSIERLLFLPDLPLSDTDIIPEGVEIAPLLDYLDQDELPGRRRVLGALRNLREALLQVIQGLKVIEAGTRSELITLQPFTMSLEDVTGRALSNRLDLMNQRANVMDNRRQMEVLANRMQAVFNLTARADVRNTGGHNPFDFNSDYGTYQAGFQFTAPLDLVQARNNYRQQLIFYQQARRAYMLAEDQVKQTVRQEWRQLRLLEANYETLRQNLRYSAIQLDVTVQSTFQPSTAAVSAIPTTGAGLRNAGQNVGLNILQALNSILVAQNQLVLNWVQYETARINIYQDMGIMEIDSRGLWIDPLYQSAPLPPASETGEPADVIIPPEPPTDLQRVPPAEAPPEPAVLRENVGPADGLGGADGRPGVVRLVDGPDGGSLADQ